MKKLLFIIPILLLLSCDSNTIIEEEEIDYSFELIDPLWDSIETDEIIVFMNGPEEVSFFRIKATINEADTAKVVLEIKIPTKKYNGAGSYLIGENSYDTSVRYIRWINNNDEYNSSTGTMYSSYDATEPQNPAHFKIESNEKSELTITIDKINLYPFGPENNSNMKATITTTFNY